MGSAGLSARIKIADPLERRLVSDIAVAGMSSVVRGHFDVENLATQLITDAAAVGMQQRQTKPDSDEYHQSKKASQGAGHITQTTVDQQWDAHLINDAEFTANAPLPSVTFDVNNSYVAQQLGQRVGEEVSRFQHVDPPRNPNGFWQRVEQRYESVFEHRALIAEGRASANSEVMRESVGHGAANEQNYLDIGYSESVVQTRAAEFAAATQLPFMIPEVVPASIAKGIMQASSLMNRWGLFGRNVPEEPLNLLGNEATNHINALRLQRSFTIEQAKSIFDEAGGLLPEVIQKSLRLDIILGNTALKEMLSTRPGNLSDWRKYVTESIPSPSGNFRMHFYHNSVTSDIYYDMDYKAVFNHEGSWKLSLSPNFEYEPPRFTP